MEIPILYINQLINPKYIHKSCLRYISIKKGSQVFKFKRKK